MKEVTQETLAKETTSLLEIAQRERVIVTRKGKPSAVLLGIEFKDEEDYALEHDHGFWEMIRERRKQKTIPLEEVKRQLGLAGPRRGKRKVGKKRTRTS